MAGTVMMMFATHELIGGPPNIPPFCILSKGVERIVYYVIRQQFDRLSVCLDVFARSTYDILDVC